MTEQAGRRPLGRTALVSAACLLLTAALAASAWLLWRSPAPARNAGLPVAEAIPLTPTSSPAPATGAGATPSTEPASVGRAPATLAPADQDPPAALALPDLGVSADVVPVGVRDDGAMEIPRDGATVGWYRWGPQPGDDTGSAVLSGHVNTRADGPGALQRLADAGVGDLLQVTTASGRTIDYRVVGVETITKSVLPVDRIFARDVPHRLTVITCGGPFQPELSSYRDNVVVVAEPVDG